MAEIPQLLLTQGEGANADILSGEAALSFSTNFSVASTEVIPGHKDLDPSEDRSDLLHAAVQTGDVRDVNMLLEAGQDVNFIIRVYPDAKATLLDNHDHSVGHIMTWRGVPMNIFHLITDHSNPSDMVAYDYSIDNPSSEDFHAVRYDDFYDTREKTPLMLAYHHDVIDLLLSNGADVNKRVDSSTHLLNVLSRSYINKLRAALGLHPFCTDFVRDRAVLFEYLRQTVLLLLNKGAKVDDADAGGRTALMRVSEMSGMEDMLKLLLSYKSSVNSQDCCGRTALRYAVERGILVNMRILIDNGADVNVIANDGLAPIHHCMKNYINVPCLSMLLDCGADVNLLDEAGNNVLMSALGARCGPALIERLCRAGAVVNHQNKVGLTPLKIVSKRSPDVEIYKILLEAHADIHIEAGTKQHRSTALSTLLNMHGLDETRNAEFLLDRGATSVYVSPEILHRAIILGEVNLVKKLILNGLPPVNIRFRRRLTAWPSRYLSPLSVALLVGDMLLARYFLDINFLTESDIPTLSRNVSILDTILLINETCFDVIQQMSSKPMSLSTLSFIKISTLLGSVNREDKVRETRLPIIFQERLLFKTQPIASRHKMCVSYEQSKYAESLLLALVQNSPINQQEENLHPFDGEYSCNERFSDGEDSSDEIIYLCSEKEGDGDNLA